MGRKLRSRSQRCGRAARRCRQGHRCSLEQCNAARTPSHVTSSPEAHDAYLRGHYSWVVGRNEDAGRYYQQAVQTFSPIMPSAGPGLPIITQMGALDGGVDPRQALPQARSRGPGKRSNSTTVFHEPTQPSEA